MEHLTLKRLRERASRGGPPLVGTLEDMLKKALGMGISKGAPFTAEDNLESGERFIYWGL